MENKLVTILSEDDLKKYFFEFVSSMIVDGCRKFDGSFLHDVIFGGIDMLVYDKNDALFLLLLVQFLIVYSSALNFRQKLPIARIPHHIQCIQALFLSVDLGSLSLL